jgi:hypothetical protein
MNSQRKLHSSIVACFTKIPKQKIPPFCGICLLLRRGGSNSRPSGYEPDELPLLYFAIWVAKVGSRCLRAKINFVKLSFLYWQPRWYCFSSPLLRLYILWNWHHLPAHLIPYSPLSAYHPHRISLLCSNQL